MFRAIMSAIAAGIRSAFRGFSWLGQHAWDYTWRATCYTADRVIDTADAVVRAPAGLLRKIAGGGGGTPPLPQPETEKQNPRHGAAMSERQAGARDAQRATASSVWKLARARVSGESWQSERVQRLMSSVQPDVREWLQMLDSQTLDRIAAAGISRVAGHVSGKRPMNGVPKVGDIYPASSTKARRPATDDEFNSAFGLVPA